MAAQVAECRSLPESPRAVADIVNEEPRECKFRKTVAFRLDESSFEEEDCCVFGKVKCYYGPVRPELTAEEEELLHWTKKHFKAWKKDCKKVARTTDEEKHKVYLNAFLDIYSNPPDDENAVGIVHRDTTCLPLATASVRGLERFIFPGLLKDQSRAKESVLKAQAKLPLEMSDHQREFVIASTSTILSRQSRHLARVIGHADSLVALGIYKSTFLPKKDKKIIPEDTVNKPTISCKKDENNKKGTPQESANDKPTTTSSTTITKSTQTPTDSSFKEKGD